MNMYKKDGVLVCETPTETLDTLLILGKRWTVYHEQRQFSTNLGSNTSMQHIFDITMDTVNNGECICFDERDQES